MASADLATARSMIGPALVNLGAEEQTAMEMTGTETTGSIVVDLAARLSVHRYLETDGRMRFYFELKSWRNGTLTRRIVGDGRRVWNYDAARHTYSSWQYDFETGDVNRDGEAGADKLLRSIRRFVSGPEDMMVRVMTEAQATRTAIGVAGARWTPWIPNADVAMLDEGFRTWTSAPRVTYADYGIEDSESGSYVLNRLENCRTVVRDGSYDKVTDWQITILHDNNPAGTHYAFDPGTARAVSVDLPQGG